MVNVIRSPNELNSVIMFRIVLSIYSRPAMGLRSSFNFKLALLGVTDMLIVADIVF